MTLVFSGRHSSETLDNVGVEFTHTTSALRIFSLPAGTISCPNSSRRHSTDARLDNDASGRSTTRVEKQSDLLQSEHSLERGGSLRRSCGIYGSNWESWIRD